MPLFYLNPINNETVDLMPLFELMADQAHAVSGPENMTRRLQNLHDFVSTRIPCNVGCEVDATGWVDTSTALVMIRKTFEQMRADPAKVPNPDAAATPTEPGTLPRSVLE